MRFNNPKVGDYRIKRKFLLLPKSLTEETRWLEWADIVQIYVRGERVHGPKRHYFFFWLDFCFADLFVGYNREWFEWYTEPPKEVE